MSVQFSEAELKLIRHFHCEMFLTSGIDVFQVYQAMVCNAFVRREESPATKALRRCFNALLACAPFRGTPEFDTMAAFEDTPPKNRSRKK